MILYVYREQKKTPFFIESVTQEFRQLNAREVQDNPVEKITLVTHSSNKIVGVECNLKRLVDAPRKRIQSLFGVILVDHGERIDLKT